MKDETKIGYLYLLIFFAVVAVIYGLIIMLW